MALAEFNRPLVTEDGKPFVREHAGAYRCEFIVGIFGSRDKQTFLDQVISQAESIGNTVINYQATMKRLEELYGSRANIPKDVLEKEVREVHTPEKGSGKFKMEVFHKVKGIDDLEDKRRIVEPMFEFVAA